MPVFFGHDCPTPIDKRALKRARAQQQRARYRDLSRRHSGKVR